MKPDLVYLIYSGDQHEHSVIFVTLDHNEALQMCPENREDMWIRVMYLGHTNRKMYTIWIDPVAMEITGKQEYTNQEPPGPLCEVDMCNSLWIVNLDDETIESATERAFAAAKEKWESLTDGQRKRIKNQQKWNKVTGR